MDSTFTCFVDESGNTGPNLTDKQQPIFVHAGLFVPTPRLDEARQLAVDLRKTCLAAADELHVGILNTREGRRRVGDLLSALGELQVVPLVNIMERRMVHAHYVADVCFDYVWNSRADQKYVTSAEEKHALAQKLVDVVSNVELDAFANAFRLRDAGALNASIDALAQALERASRPELASSIRGAKEQMAEQCEALNEADASATAMNTINVSSFAVVLSLCERFARDAKFEKGEFVHDECPQFPAYKMMFELGQKLDGDIAFDNGMSNVPIRRIGRLATGDSKTEPLLQLADVIAGMFRKLTTQKNRLQDRVLDPWLAFTVAFENRWSHTMVSRQLEELVWNAAMKRRAT